jgi:hypothetical protein
MTEDHVQIQVSQDNQFIMIYILTNVPLSECQLPPTRAKSPKLGRRKSCNNRVNSSQPDKVKRDFNDEKNQSQDSSREDTSNPVSQHGLLKGHAISKFEDETQQAEEIDE